MLIPKKLTHRDVVEFLARVPDDHRFRDRLRSSAGDALSDGGFASNGQVETLLGSLASRAPGGAKSVAPGRDGIDFARDL